MAAAEESFQSEFSRALECNVCMDRLDDPKILACHHSFCKNCLDAMIRFSADGSGRIICPMRCDIVTTIDVTMTTNDLAAPYQLKCVLDAYNKQSVRYKSTLRHLRCSGETQCINSGTIYCESCSLILCQSCKTVHDNKKHNENSRYYNIRHDRKDDKTKIVCSKHNTVSEYYCCNEVICVYCKEREHSNHRAETVTEQINKIKEVLHNDEYGANKMDTVIENTLLNAESTQLSISLLHSLIQKRINARKINCLYKYLQQLNREEQRLMEQFQNITNKHMKDYPRKNDSSDLFKDIFKKEEFELLLSKEKIVRTVADYTKCICTMNVGLTSPTTDNPLGNLHVEEDEMITIGSRRKVASISQYFSNSAADSDNVSPTTSKKLKSLLQRVLPEECFVVQNSQQLSSTDEEQKSLPTLFDATLRNTEEEGERPVEIEDVQIETTVVTSSGGIAVNDNYSPSPSNDNTSLVAALSEVKGRGISYIRDLCKYKDEELILTLLQLCPSIATLRNEMGNTPLHFAALNGCARVIAGLLNMDSKNLDVLNALGSSPIHYATENHHVDCVAELLNWKCDLTIENLSGYTPLQIAQKYNFDDVILLLQEAISGAKS